MEWFERLNESLDYIEKNLDKELSYEKAARIACCSVNHYQRMFSFISNTTLAEYIRRRRLTRAAFELQNSDIGVIDISIKYGYNSPTAFTRAFLSVHGVTPSEARKLGTILKSYPRISFQMAVKGEKELDYRLEEKEEFRIVGIKEAIINDGVYNMKRIPLMWIEAKEKGSLDDIVANYREGSLGMMGICADFKDNSFDYYIGIPSRRKAEKGMAELTVEKGVWAIFECVGVNGMQSTWNRIFAEWFPSSGYEILNAPEIEWYPESSGNADTCKAEIWIPVIKQRRTGIRC